MGFVSICCLFLLGIFFPANVNFSFPQTSHQTPSLTVTKYPDPRADQFNASQQLPLLSNKLDFLTFNSTMYSNGTLVTGRGVNFTYAALKANTNPNYNFSIYPVEAYANLTWIQSTFISVEMINTTSTTKYNQMYMGLPPGLTGGEPTSVVFRRSNSNTTVLAASFCTTVTCFRSHAVPAVLFLSSANEIETNESNNANAEFIFVKFAVSNSVSQPIQLVQLPGGAATATFTLSGCSVSPSSIVSGATTTVTATPNCQITITKPVDNLGNGKVYRFPGGVNSNTQQQFNTCASGTCSTQSFNVYLQVVLSFGIAFLSGGGGGTASLSLKVFGGSISAGINTVIGNVTMDWNSMWSIASTTSNSNANERWVVTNGTTSGTATTFTSNLFTYQHQFWLLITVSPGGTGTTSIASQWRNAYTNTTITATASGSNVFLNWTGTGTVSYSGTLATTHPINSTTAITETAFFTAAASLITVQITLSKGNNQPTLNASSSMGNYILVNYTSSGVPITMKLSDGLNSFSADPNSLVVFDGDSENSNSTFRQCINSCNNFQVTLPASGSYAQTFSYWGQFNITMEFTAPDNNPLATQKPLVGFNTFGSLTALQLQTFFQTIWMDNGSTWSMNNPFTYNTGSYTPNPLSAQVVKAALYDITYTKNNIAPLTSDPFTAFVQGEYLLGFVLSYGNLISVGWFLAFLILSFDAYIYLKSGNAGLSLAILFIAFALFTTVGLGVNTSSSFLTSSVWQVALIFGALFFTGSIYRLFFSRN